MKCPFRKEVVHYPEQKVGYVKEFARDTEEYADCYERGCPFYREVFGEEHCKRAEVIACTKN